MLNSFLIVTILILYYAHLNDVGEDLHGSERDPHAVDGVHEGLQEITIIIDYEDN